MYKRQSLIREDVVIEISAGRDDVRRKVRLPNLQKEKKYSDSLIEKKFIQLSKPSLRDQASDLERILAQVGKNKKVAFSLLGGLPEIVRKADFEVTAVLVEDEPVSYTHLDVYKRQGYMRYREALFWWICVVWWKRLSGRVPYCSSICSSDFFF